MKRSSFLLASLPTISENNTTTVHNSAPSHRPSLRANPSCTRPVLSRWHSSLSAKETRAPRLGSPKRSDDIDEEDSTERKPVEGFVHGPTAKDEAHCCASELRFRVQFDRIRANQSLLPTLEPAKDPPRMPQRHSGFFPEADDRIQ